jgi:hypothetical protein
MALLRSHGIALVGIQDTTKPIVVQNIRSYPGVSIVLMPRIVFTSPIAMSHFHLVMPLGTALFACFVETPDPLLLTHSPSDQQSTPPSLCQA